MEDIVKNNIKENSDAYKAGLEGGEKWVKDFEAKGQEVKMPIFNPPSNSLEYYYIKGYNDAINKMAHFTSNRQPSKHTFILDNRKVRPNCIDKMVRERGKDFIIFLGGNGGYELFNFAKRVIRDLINSNIDVDKYKTQFENIKLLDAIISECEKEMTYHKVMSEALNLLVMSTESDGLKSGFLTYHETNARVYQMLYDAFTEFKAYIKEGIFNSDIIMNIEQVIYTNRYTNLIRDPYSRTRV